MDIKYVHYTSNDVWVMAQTVYGEARGEIYSGKIAVAWVIINRLDSFRWKGYTIAGVCLAPWQFSCMNLDSPNREKLLTVNFRDVSFRRCMHAVMDVLGGTHPDNTKGAKHYYAFRGEMPYWAEGKIACVMVGNHAFYNNID